MPTTPGTKTFAALLERTRNPLRWVIVRVPFNLANVWGKRGQIRVQGEINGFAFRSTLFPTGKGEHFLIVNKRMQAGAKTALGSTARFRLFPDTAPREVYAPPKELLRELKQSRRVMKFYESLSDSQRNDISKWIAQAKQEETRMRRSQQMAERLMETLEAERELPPIMQAVFRRSPGAQAAWERLSPSHRRAHLFRVFYYRDPQSRAQYAAKCVEEMLTGRKAVSERKKLISDED
ncbi:MAG: YdeI/OmpD-associated family protein [Candidatus Angelobacter sp.]